LVVLLSFRRRPPKVDVVNPVPPAPMTEPAVPSKPLSALPRKSAIFFGLMLALYVVAELSIGTRLALYARRDAGFTVETANWMVSGYFLAMFVGRVAFAIFQSSLGSRPILWFSAISAIVTFSLGLLVNPIWLVITGLTLAPFYPVTISLANEEFGEHAGYVVSWCITMQALLLMAMHFVIGALSDAFGLGVALWIGPVSLLGVVILLAGKLTRPTQA
jgi:MFS transporter, FHS family, glucose/mannose:H+ symporter